MNSIQRNISVTRKTFYEKIEVTKGTNMIPIILNIVDFAIPITASAVAYVIGIGESTPRTKLCEIEGNKITIRPTKALFSTGTNVMQIRVIDGEKALITFEMFVRCGDNSIKLSDQEEEQQQTLIEQLLSMHGYLNGSIKLEEQKRTEAIQKEKEERTNADSVEKRERLAGISAEKDERKKEINVERKRIDNLAKLQNGSTTGDAELIDIRVGADGEEYENAGDAVRGQVSKLNGHINACITKSNENLYNPLTNYDETGIRNTGEQVQEPGYFSTDFIILPQYEENKKLVSSSNAYKFVFYDDDRKQVAYSSAPSDVQLLDTYKQVRIMYQKKGSGVKNFRDNIYVSVINKDGRQPELEKLPLPYNINLDLININSGGKEKHEWKYIGINNNTGIVTEDSAGDVISTPKMFRLEPNKIISIRDGYKLRVFRYGENGTKYLGVVELISPKYYVTEEDVLYRFSISARPLAQIPLTLESEIIVKSVLESKQSTECYISGENIDLEYHQCLVRDFTDFTLPIEGAKQACDIYEKIYVQFTTDNNCSLYDVEKNEKIGDYEIESGHGNSCQFSRKFENPTDKYPLLYNSGWRDNYVYVNRIFDTGIELIRKYDLSEIEKFRHNCCIEPDGRYMYTLSYNEADTDDSPVNYSIFSVWDLTKSTLVEGKTYKPKLLSTKPIPIIEIQQDMKFFNGRIYVTSGLLPYSVTRIFGLNTSGDIVTEIKGLPSYILNTEPEGIFFRYDKKAGRYRMIVMVAGGKMYEVLPN